MQLLLRNDTADRAAWRADFDAQAEARGNAGLTLLQLWSEPDAPNRVWALFEVNDPARARAFMDRPQSGFHAEDAGITASEYHLLDTA